MKAVRFEGGELLEPADDQSIELAEDEVLVAISADELEVMSEGLRVGVRQIGERINWNYQISGTHTEGTRLNRQQRKTEELVRTVEAVQAELQVPAEQ